MQRTTSAKPEMLRPFTEVMVECSTSSPITIENFLRCCDSIMPFFVHMGPVFSVARYEFSHKLETLRGVSSTETLEQLVQADIE